MYSHICIWQRMYMASLAIYAHICIWQRKHMASLAIYAHVYAYGKYYYIFTWMYMPIASK